MNLTKANPLGLPVYGCVCMCVFVCVCMHRNVEQMFENVNKHRQKTEDVRIQRERIKNSASTNEPESANVGMEILSISPLCSKNSRSSSSVVSKFRLLTNTSKVLSKAGFVLWVSSLSL